MLQVRLGCVERVLGLRPQPLRPCLHHRRPHRRQVAGSGPAVAKGSQLYPPTGSGASLPPKDTRKQSGRTERRPSPSSSRAGAPLPRLGRVRSPPSRRPNRTPPPPISAGTPPPPAASTLNAVARGQPGNQAIRRQVTGHTQQNAGQKGKTNHRAYRPMGPAPSVPSASRRVRRTTRPPGDRRWTKIDAVTRTINFGRQIPSPLFPMAVSSRESHVRRRHETGIRLRGRNPVHRPQTSWPDRSVRRCTVAECETGALALQWQKKKKKMSSPLKGTYSLSSPAYPHMVSGRGDAKIGRRFESRRP